MKLRIPSVPLLLTAAGLALLLAAGSARAQIPEKFTNLKVLPKSITREQLLGVMRGFTGGLGVRCDHCHAEDETSKPPRTDFASDAKKEKKIARGMMKMASQINHSLLPKTGVQSPPEVTCVTCHHGLPEPRTLADALESSIAKGGVPAAQSTYKDLREKYYGSGAYDFRPSTLATVADWVAHERKDPDGAIALLQFSLGIDPNAADTYASLGRLQAEKGDKDAAVASYKKALELEPDNPRLQHELQQLEGGK